MIYNTGKIKMPGVEEKYIMNGLESDSQFRILEIMEKYGIEEWSLEELNQPSRTEAARVCLTVHEKHSVNAPLAAKEIQEEVPPAYIKTEVFVELVPNDRPIYKESKS